MNPNLFQPLTVLGTDEIREILVKRIYHQKQAVGITVGVIEPNRRRVVAYGNLASGDPRTLDGDTIFEIGSVSKVFTSLVLADMVNRKEVTIDDPAAKYLPENVKVPERSGKSITLLDLSTHSSGLPPLPSNLMKLKDPRNPNADDYSVDDLCQFLSGYTLPRDPGSEFEYSNLGAGLLEAFLGYKESPLAPAMKAMLEVRRPAAKIEIGLAWLIYSTDGQEIAMHGGRTGGFCSFVGYDSKRRIGVVVLSNASTPSGVDDIGLHLLNPKLPLANPEPPKQCTEIHIDPKLLDNYTGRYQVTPNLIFEITRDGDRLFAQAFAQLPRNRPGDPTVAPKFELFAEDEKNFFAMVADNQITFETGPEGRATSLILHRAGRAMPAAARLS